MFELDKKHWYTVDTVEENAFLNQKPTDDLYGIWYSVKFEGDAQKYLWQTKTPPSPNTKYWGMLQKTTSGKSVKFKWDKLNTPSDESTGPVGAVKHIDNQESINRAVALRHAAVLYQGVGTEDSSDIILRIADKFYTWLTKTSIEEDISSLSKFGDEGIDY